MVARQDQATDPALLAGLLQARRGTAFFARKLNELGDAELDGDSLLPGWSRRHIVAHIGYNARAIARLVEWAATSVENPMYPSVAVRNEEIAFGATLSPTALRNLYGHSAVHLSVEWRDLPDPAWSKMVRTIQGREVPASETVWMRSREVWVHAVDLDNGATFGDLPDDVLIRLLGDIAGAWRARGTDAEFRVEVLDPSGSIQAQYGNPDSQRVFSGSLPAITQWAAGRGTDAVADSSANGSGTAPAPAWI